MNSTTDTPTPHADADKTLYPTAGRAASNDDRPADPSRLQQPLATAPAADGLLKRMTQKAHDAVDGVSDRIASTVDDVQGRVDQVGDTRDEWLESAREAIRQHPFAAIGTAVLVGLALRGRTSSRER